MLSTMYNSFVSNFSMTRRRISDLVEGIVLGLLRKKMSYRKIVAELKDMGHSVSVGAINRIHHAKGLIRNKIRNNLKIGTFQKRRTAATNDVISKIRNMIKSVNPPTQREMASKLGISQATVQRTIAKIIRQKLRKKCGVHKLNNKQIEKRRARAWRLYLRLNNGKWKNYVTTDEAMFYMGGSYGRRRVCYVKGDGTDNERWIIMMKFVKRDSFATGFMV